MPIMRTNAEITLTFNSLMEAWRIVTVMLAKGFRRTGSSAVDETVQNGRCRDSGAGLDGGK